MKQIVQAKPVVSIQTTKPTYAPTEEYAAIWKVAKGIVYLGDNLLIASRQAYSEATKIDVGTLTEEHILSEACQTLTNYFKVVGVPDNFNLIDVLFVLTNWHIRHVIGIKNYKPENNTKILLQSVLETMNTMPIRDIEGHVLLELNYDS